MPLTKSSSKKAVGENIKREMKSKPHKQAIAIALDTQRRAAGLINRDVGKSHKSAKRY